MQRALTPKEYPKNEMKKNMKRKIVKAVIRFFMRIMFRIKIEGKENVPTEGACLICPNHKSYYDPPLVVAFNKRHITMIAKEELNKNPFLAWLMKTFDAFTVQRDGKDIETVRHSLKVLKEGGILGIFPEGTRNGMEKGVKVKNGAVQMAIKSGAPIIPVGIKGEFKFFRKITMTYGEPIYYDKTKIDQHNKEELDALTQELMNKIVSLTK